MGLGLMERAGAAAVALAAKICMSKGRPILIVAGPGNNGGDALVVARLLLERLIACHLVLIGEEATLPSDAKNAWQKYLAAGGMVYRDLPMTCSWDLVIDGLFGAGLARTIDGRYAEAINHLQRAALQSGCPLLALDCPSGLDVNTGTRNGPCIVATHTITFLGLKPGLLTADGPDLCGKITIAELGVTTPNLSAEFIGHRSDPTDFDSLFQKRMRNCHKGSFGTVGIIGGAPGMAGAALLAGRAALKLGAGKVLVGFPGEPPLPVDPLQLELMLHDADTVLRMPITALACGPGLGQSDAAQSLLRRSIASPYPIVLDADALNLLGNDSQLSSRLPERSATTILTPHPGEAARLLGLSISEIQADRLSSAKRLAVMFQCWIVLKGCGSIIVSPKGVWWINTTGNPGLASAGTGDVLSGLLAALLARDVNAKTAILGAVWLHGAAADLVADGNAPGFGGTIGLTASELPDAARVLFNHLATLPNERSRLLTQSGQKFRPFAS